jgi:site-specific recombinase XerC
MIMKWAANHPEPVYPTWEEWLITQGVIKENPSGGVGYPMPKLFEHIPADIAQKLGIEPKEG